MMKKILLLILTICSHFNYAQNWKGLVDSSYINIWSMTCDSVNDRLILGGYIVNIDTIVNINGVASYDGNQITEISPNGDPNLNLTRSVIFYHGELYVGGSFGQPYLMKYNGTSWISIGATGSVINMSLINNELFVVGSFDSIAGIPARYIAKYNGTTWQAINFDYINTPQIINCIQSLNGELYIGGTIDQQVTGMRVTLLKYNSLTLHWEECVPLFNNLMINISNMYVYKSELYLAGNPPLGGTGPVILSYDGINLKSVGGGLEGNNPRINGFCEWDEKLVCAGFFNKAGLIDAKGLAFWDGTNWCTIPSSHGNEVFSCVGVYQDTLYIAGTFAHMEGDSTVKRFAKWLGGANYTECTTTSINESEKLNINRQISFNPNPTSNLVHISSIANIEKIEIYDLYGKALITKNNLNENMVTLDFSELNTGYYLIKIMDKNGNTDISKLIKN